MINSSIYLATRDIAERTGVIASAYRTRDGRYIINHNDLMRVRFSTEELLQGISDKVQQITKEEATSLIQENNYQMGYEGLEPNNNNQQEQPQVEHNDETPENTETETIEENEVGNVEDILGVGTQQDENNKTSEEETETKQQNQEEE